MDQLDLEAVTLIPSQSILWLLDDLVIFGFMGQLHHLVLASILGNLFFGSSFPELTALILVGRHGIYTFTLWVLSKSLDFSILIVRVLVAIVSSIYLACLILSLLVGSNIFLNHIFLIYLL